MGRRELALAGLERPVLQLWKAHFESVIGQIRVTGTWLWHEDRWQPCLALTDARKHPAKCVPCVIRLETAWIWAFHGDVGDPVAAFNSIAEWLAFGYLPGDASNPNDCMAIVNAVNLRLTDLIAMPPRPPGEEVAYGTVRITNKTTGEVITEQELKHDV